MDGDLVNKLGKIIGILVVSELIKTIIHRNDRIGNDVDVMRQAACLVVNPINVNNLLPSLIVQRWVRPQTQ